MKNLVLIVTENGRNFVGERVIRLAGPELKNPVELLINVVENKPNPRDFGKKKDDVGFTVSFPVKAFVHPFLCLDSKGEVKEVFWKIPENYLYVETVKHLQEAVSKKIFENYDLYWEKFQKNPPKLFIDNGLKLMEKDGKIITLGK